MVHGKESWETAILLSILAEMRQVPTSMCQSYLANGRLINEPVEKAKAPVAHTVRIMMYSAES